MDTEREYTASEKAQHQPPACPACGGRQSQHWRESTAMGTGTRYRLSITECLNPDCTRNGGS